MTETPHEISSRLSPLRDKIINPATRGLRPRLARKLSLGKLSGRKRCPVKPQTTLSVRGQTFCYKTNYKSLTVTNKTNKYSSSLAIVV